MTAAEVRYAFLDLLPKRLFRPTLANVHGRVIVRGEAILKLRESLLDGTLPAQQALDWPEEPAIRAALLDALRDANVAPYCNGDPEITDELVLFILQVVGDAHHLYDRALIAFHTLARKDQFELVSFEPDALADTAVGCAPAGAKVRKLGGLDWDKARADAAKLMTTMLRARTMDKWQARIAAMSELEEVFAKLAQTIGLPHGIDRGMLRSLPHNDLIELQATLHHIPALTELIRTLGRMQETDDEAAPNALEQIGRAVQRVVDAEREVRGDRGVEVRGIERSGDVARMLPTEAALLTSPVLRALWRARWTERALLSYHAPGVLTKRVSDKQTFEDGVQIQHLRAERGPILIVLDTSGSMAGYPERVAKAIVIQLLAIAHMEERRCFVYNFSGEGDLAEHELSFDGDGMMAMLGFISCSFYGGTVPDEALRRACRRLLTDEWKQADLVMVSDGHFYIQDNIAKLIGQTRADSQARFHAVATDAGTGFDRLLCDSRHDIADWLQPVFGS